jgi:hypothetical protein
LATSSVRAGSTIPEPVGTTDPILAEPVTGLESFSVHRQTPDTLVLRVSAPGAQLVEVTGDFSGWSPVPMKEREGGTWEAGFSLPPGQYQMNLRVDGANWVVPPGLLSLKDEFGGSVGLLVIE